MTGTSHPTHLLWLAGASVSWGACSQATLPDGLIQPLGWGPRNSLCNQLEQVCMPHSQRNAPAEAPACWSCLSDSSLAMRPPRELSLLHLIRKPLMPGLSPRFPRVLNYVPRNRSIQKPGQGPGCCHPSTHFLSYASSALGHFLKWTSVSAKQRNLCFSV